jgi:hypothetical protein
MLAGIIGVFTVLNPAYGESDWKTEFAATCAQSDDAMSFSIPELKKLIDRCGRLQTVIEAQDETVRKVYLKRLQICKNLYMFVLDTKMQEQKPK